jgi:P-type Ca2+ transporter type 2C
MQRPPRDPREGVFSTDVKAFILLALLVEIPFFYYLFYHDFADMNFARTEMFFLFIIIEMIIALNFRSMRYSVFKVPPHKWLWIAIAWEFVMVAVLIQFPVIRDTFGINIPSASMLGTIIGFGAVVFLSMEVIKAVLKKKMRAGRKHAGVQS